MHVFVIFLYNFKGNWEAKNAIKFSVLEPLINKKLYQGLRAPSTGILLAGVPGNGKTLLVGYIRKIGQTENNIFAMVAFNFR